MDDEVVAGQVAVPVPALAVERVGAVVEHVVGVGAERDVLHRLGVVGHVLAIADDAGPDGDAGRGRAERHRRVPT